MSHKLTTKISFILILALFLTVIPLGQANATPILKYKMEGEQVATLQQTLKDAGYNPGPVNGFFGYATKRAVIKFQSDNGIPVTGYVNQSTWDALFERESDSASEPDPAPPENDSSQDSTEQDASDQNQTQVPEDTAGDTTRIILKYRDKGEKVEELQTRLTKLDYNPGPVNGYYAYMTKRAVRKFQSENSLEVTGDVDEVTWNLLKSKSGQVHIPGEDNDEEKQDNSDDSTPTQNNSYQISEGDLIKKKTSPKVYIIENGKKRHIVSPEVLRGLGYKFADVREVPDWVLNRLNTGAPVIGEETPDSDESDPVTQEPGEQEPINDNPQPDDDPVQRSAPNTGQLTAAEKQMLNLVNQERTSRGLEPLEVDMKLVKLARKKSRDMIENNYFSHTSPTYGSPFAMLKSAGIRYRMAGENIATNPSVTGAHEALMNSSGHRRNLLKAGYTKVGIGVVAGAQHGKMFTQLFMDEF